MLPIIICRHYDVDWLNSRTCKCRDCGKQGHWTKQGFAIWLRTEPAPDRLSSPSSVREGCIASFTEATTQLTEYERSRRLIA